MKKRAHYLRPGGALVALLTLKQPLVSVFPNLQGARTIVAPKGRPMTDKPVRRMTLRQLLTHSEKVARDLIDHVQTTLLVQVSDFRELSRPVRRRSHYPTLLAIHNALKKVVQASEEVNALSLLLQEQLQEIREHARRERIHRV